MCWHYVPTVKSCIPQLVCIVTVWEFLEFLLRYFWNNSTLVKFLPHINMSQGQEWNCFSPVKHMLTGISIASSEHQINSDKFKKKKSHYNVNNYTEGINAHWLCVPHAIRMKSNCRHIKDTVCYNKTWSLLWHLKNRIWHPFQTENPLCTLPLFTGRNWHKTVYLWTSIAPTCP